MVPPSFPQCAAPQVGDGRRRARTRLRDVHPSHDQRFQQPELLNRGGQRVEVLELLAAVEAFDLADLVDGDHDQGSTPDPAGGWGPPVFGRRASLVSRSALFLV